MIGQVVSHYRILEKLGEGGMGAVYLAEDTGLGRKVAIKFLSSDKASDPESRKRFIHEAKSQAMVSHLNVASFYEVGEEGDKVFIVMEYIEGQKLADLAKIEKLSLAEILDIAIQIGEGLQTAHEKGVMHRDINPTNILTTSKRVAKITDFGLAKWKGASTITQSGLQMGTDAYMSPEQVEGRKPDFRTDIFSLGVVLYELICARRPFEGASRESLFYEILYVQPQPLARYCRDLPEALERIVSKCLAKKPEERYQSAADLVGDLKTAKRAVESAGPPSRIIKPTRRRRALGVVAAAAVVLSLVAIYFFRPSKPAFSGEKSIAVLPFANMSGDPENEYFSDGITEDVITQLSKIGELKVIARTSTMGYKKSGKPIREIGKELNVATILEGSVRRAGNQVRIAAQLVDAKTEGHIWAETYDKEMAQIFAIQSEIAQQIAAALKVKLSTTEEERLEKIPTGNLTAYDYYLKGREYYDRNRKQDNEQAITLFKKALELDSNYALAYAGLGDAYEQKRVVFGFPRAWRDSAIEASKKAISINPNLAEGYRALGLSYYNNGWIRKSLEALHKSIELNPNYAPALENIALPYRQMGELDKALHWRKKGIAVDPKRVASHSAIGAVYMVLGEDQKAEQSFNRALELQPDHILSIRRLIVFYIYQGKYQEAFNLAQKGLANDSASIRYLGTIELCKGNYSQAKEYFQRTITPDSTEADFINLGYIYWKTGQPEIAKQLLDKGLKRNQERLNRGNEFPAILFDIASIYAIQGSKVEAYSWLQKAIDAGWLDYRWALIDPKLENLRSDEKFKKMMASVKAKVDEMRRRVEEEEE